MFVVHGRQTHQTSQVLGYYDNYLSYLGRKRPRMSCLRHVYYVFGLENLNCPKAISCVQHRGCLKLPCEQEFLSCMAFEHLRNTTTSLIIFTVHSFHHDRNFFLLPS